MIAQILKMMVSLDNSIEVNNNEDRCSNIVHELANVNILNNHSHCISQTLRRRGILTNGVEEFVILNDQYTEPTSYMCCKDQIRTKIWN